MNNHPLLYSFRRCPYAIRARMAIKLAKIDINIIDIALKDKPEAMLKASNKGTVPVLVLANNNVIDESLEIMLWALKQCDDMKLLSNLDSSLSLIDYNDGKFKYALDRYKYPNRYEDEVNDTNWQSEGCKFLQILESNLEKHSYLVDSELRLADFAIFPFIRQFRMPDNDWFDNNQNYPKLIKWFSIMSENEIFKNTMIKIK